MKRIPITPFLILAALFTVIGASVYMEAEAEKRKQEELQRQQEEYLEKYEKAENAILMQDYNTAVELLENLPENFKDKEYVLVYAKYCKSVADGETIHTQYRITWELPHEGDMYTGDFAEEMKIARETAAKENEAEERRLKKEKEKKEREKIKQDQPYRGMDEKYITSTIWGFYDKNITGGGMQMKTQSKKRKIIRTVLLVILLLLIVAAGGFISVYESRFQTISSIQKVTDYDEYNLYRMDVKYDYDLDRLIEYGITDNQSFVDAIVKEALPILPVHIKAPDFGCSAFTLQEADGNVLMGRNYDFKRDTSAMLVYCEPKDGYKSVAFAALDNISANIPDASMKKKLATLTAPFICLDGMNEKGVSIAVLTLDSEPVHQNTGRPVIGTTLVIRLILDRAATTEEAVELLNQYDMFATSGRDYHFYITDASGDGRVVEYDCESETREMVATPIRSITNFFGLYRDKVLPNQKNGIYGHGKERYDKMEAIFDYEEVYTSDVAWEALKAASQEPSEEEVTSNTQWSIVYDDTNLTAEIALRRNWDDVIGYNLKDNTIILK